MSRIGRKEIVVPAGVTVTIEENNVVTVKGPKGTLTKALCPTMNIKQEGNIITIERPSDAREDRAKHGLTRALLNDMVEGVEKEFSKTLEIVGIGYRAQKQGNAAVLNIGYSHQVTVEEVPGIHIDVPSPNSMVIHGPDKQQVGQFAADVRKIRPPEPYKGKGIKYSTEVVRRKEIMKKK